MHWPHIATWSEEGFRCAKSPHNTCSSWKTSGPLSQVPKIYVKIKQKFLGLPEHQLINDCITRWGSTYEMLKRFIEQQQAICAMLLEDGDNRSLMPSTLQMKLLQ